MRIKRGVWNLAGVWTEGSLFETLDVLFASYNHHSFENKREKLTLIHRSNVRFAEHYEAWLRRNLGRCGDGCRQEACTFSVYTGSKWVIFYSLKIK